MVKYSDIVSELQSLIECSEFFLAVTYNRIILMYKLLMYLWIEIGVGFIVIRCQ